MKIREYDQIGQDIKERRDISTLDRFIHDNEPSDVIAAAYWRQQLQAAIDELTAVTYKPAEEPPS